MTAEREALRLGIEYLTVSFPTEVSSFDFQVESTDRTVQYKLNAQSLRLVGLHRTVNDAHRAGANRLQNNKHVIGRKFRSTWWDDGKIISGENCVTPVATARPEEEAGNNIEELAALRREVDQLRRERDVWASKTKQTSGAILYLRALQGHSGRSFIDPTLQPERLLPVHLSYRMCNQFTFHHQFRIDTWRSKI